MRTKLLLAGALLWAVLGVAIATPHLEEYKALAPGSSHLPAPFTDYVILPGTTSPDGQYAFIYPNRSVVGPTYPIKMPLVALKPFRVILETSRLHDYYAPSAHQDFEVYWAPDNSAVVAIFGAKWGPGKVYLIPLRDGKPGRIIDLTAQVARLAMPDFKRAKPERFNNHFAFIFEDGNHLSKNSRGQWIRDAGWTINERNQVIIDCICDSDPNMGSAKPWAGTVTGLWDIAQGKFVKAEFVRTK